MTEIRGPRTLDVLGAGQPWEVPQDWLAGVRDRLRAWGDDPHALRPGAFPEFVSGTPAAVWYTHQVAPLLAGWIPVLHGDLADLGAVLARDFHRPSSRLGGAGHVVRTAGFDWPLKVISGARNFPQAGRRQAVELSRDVVSLFLDAPPLAVRARALAAVFDRVLADPELTRLHTAAPFEEIGPLWRGSLLQDEERAVLPELAGPNAVVRHSLTALRDAHAGLSEADDFARTLAGLILATGLTMVPAPVAEPEVEKAFDEARDGFDAKAWLANNTDWLMRQDKAAARAWAAAATQVSVQLAGVLVHRPWPAHEVPDLGALFRWLDGGAPTQLAQAPVVQAEAPVAQIAETVQAPPELAPVVESGDAEGVDLESGPMAELDALIGLESVKDAVRRMVAETKTNLRRKELGMPIQERARHMVFVGKPGTAKTTIARLLSRIYKELGVLERGHVIECDRSDLVGPGIGSTAPMTAAKFREALGGVLFVDEAYTLVPPNSQSDYGHEAIATLLKMMEDHRDECVVIVAGYHREMQRFMESNTGLASRFPKMLAFAEYNDDQLVQIFQLQARQVGMMLADGVLDSVRKVIPPAPRGHTFGNGRFIRNVLEEAISNQATRLAERDPDSLTERDLRELLPLDVKPPTSMHAEDYLLQKPGT